MICFVDKFSNTGKKSFFLTRLHLCRPALSAKMQQLQKNCKTELALCPAHLQQLLTIIEI
jgi:hypothetical protein